MQKIWIGVITWTRWHKELVNILVFCVRLESCFHPLLLGHYKTRVRSVMEYCGPIWQNAPKNVLNKLDAIQRKACRIFGTDLDTCRKMNIHNLEHRRNVSGLSQLHRMVSGAAPNSVVQLLPPFQEPTRISRHVVQNHHFQLNVKRSKTEHHKKSFIPRLANLWNST